MKSENSTKKRELKSEKKRVNHKEEGSSQEQRARCSRGLISFGSFNGRCEMLTLKMKHQKCVSCSVLSDSVTPWTVTHQAPLSMEFSRQEYWSG